jgi:hypothetical protein
MKNLLKLCSDIKHINTHKTHKHCRYKIRIVISAETDCTVPVTVSCCFAYPTVYIRRYTAVTWYRILCAIYTPLQTTTLRPSLGTNVLGAPTHTCSDSDPL